MYAFEILSELPQPSVDPHYFFPGARKDGGRDGVIVRIYPDDTNSWLGTFAFGQVASNVSGVYTMPDLEKLCVVARGAGYIVTVANPYICEPVQAIPILDVRTTPTRDLIVFADDTALTAYDANGLRWRTERIAWDGLEITQITELSILGKYPELGGKHETEFVVDVATGAHRGGIGRV